MNYLIFMLLGFVLGLLYSKGKKSPLTHALSDVGRFIDWAWGKLRGLWSSCARRYVLKTEATRDMPK